MPHPLLHTWRGPRASTLKWQDQFLVHLAFSPPKCVKIAFHTLCKNLNKYGSAVSSEGCFWYFIGHFSVDYVPWNPLWKATTFLWHANRDGPWSQDAQWNEPLTKDDNCRTPLLGRIYAARLRDPESRGLGWGLGEREPRSWCSLGREFHLCKQKRILEMHCTTRWVHRTPVSWTRKMVKMPQFMC